MHADLQILALNPPGFPSCTVGLAAKHAGFEGGLSLEHTSLSQVQPALAELNRSAKPLYLVVPDASPQWLTLIQDAVEHGLQRVILCSSASRRLGSDLPRLREVVPTVWAEVTDVGQAVESQALGADAIVAKGNEAGGFVGEETTFVLLQRVISSVNVPVWARGGIGLRTSAACLAAGAAGVVLDWQLGLTSESQLSRSVKDRLRRMDGSETAIVGQDLSIRYRVFGRPGEDGFAAIREIEKSIIEEGHTATDAAQKWHDAVRRQTCSETDKLLPIGQDAAFAAPLSKRFRTVRSVCKAVRDEAERLCRLAARDQSLRPGGPFAASHSIEFPIVQGPMTRVSDCASFASSVATSGGLPFLALALMRAPQVRDLLAETQRELKGRSWGVGILGFVPKELREEQLREVMKHPPPYAIIAGGRPDQAKQLDEAGIRTYLHVPSPGLLELFLESDSRRFIFEGRECGGHVGPRTSFVLWDMMIDVILTYLKEKKDDPEEYHVLFAGGIHDERSAAMVAALAAPLTDLGVRIGVLMGTAYLFTTEAVSSGAIVPSFQAEALACEQTVLLQSGVGHATRAVDSPFAEHFAKQKKQLLQDGRTQEEIRDSLEGLNLGRLRIASKGIVRDSDSQGGFKQLDADEQREQGMYMIGQVAALRNSVTTIRELHAQVSEGACHRLDRFKPKSLPVKRGGASDIAIIGMACLMPKASDLETYWENILNKVDAITEVPKERWDWRLYFDEDRTARDRVYSKWGGFMAPIAFDPTAYGMPPNSVPSVEPLQLLALEVVGQALADAGYDHRPFDRERTCVIIGAGGGVSDLGNAYGFRALLPYFMTQAGGSVEDASKLIEQLDGTLPEWTEDSFAGLLMNVAAGRVANRYDLGGTNFTVDAACASSLAAVRLAAAELETHASDMAIVGGADTMQSPFAYLCFSKTHALSPTGRCRTFDAAADGIVTSEGLAFVILKRIEDARRDGDRVYAVLKAVGASSDGRQKGLTAPRPAGQMLAIRRAYEKADIDAKTIGLVEAHGTGTVAGDQSEIESLSTVLEEAGARKAHTAIGSVKSCIGHTKCSAGIAGLIKATKALHHKVLPPTAGIEQPNPSILDTALYLNTETRPWLMSQDQSPRRAGVSSFGFGGTNHHAVLEEYTDSNDGAGSAAWPAELFVWRGESAEQIIAELDKILAAFDAGAEPTLAELAACLSYACSQQQGEHALSIVAGSREDLIKYIHETKSAIQAKSQIIRDPRGIYYQSKPVEGQVAFLFPGQGSQKINMMRDLAIAFPGVREVFEQADRALGNALGRPMSEMVFPRPVFTDEESQANESALTQTNVAQPAIGAADLAMFRILSDLGIRPDMAGGHSYGEYAALCAAGALAFDDLIRISEARGRLILAAAGDEPGTMAAIGADEESVRSIISGIDGVEIANLNSPKQTVVTGPQAAIEKAIECCNAQQVPAKQIKVSCAFHSQIVSGAQKPFSRELAGLTIRPPKIPVFSNTTTEPHARDADVIRKLLVDHLVNPVRFLDEVRAMHDAGARVFVEVGPGRTLTDLVSRSLEGRDLVAVPTDQSNRNGIVSLLHALGVLHSVGRKFSACNLFDHRLLRVVDIDHLVAQTKPPPPSPTSWTVDGGKATPLNEKLKKPKAQIDSMRVLVGSEETAASGRSNGSGGKHLLPAQVAQTGPAPMRQVTGDDAADDSQQQVHQPMVASVHNNGGPHEVEAVMSSYHQVMTKFLDTQRNIMLSYMQNGAGSARPVAATQLESASPTIEPAVAIPQSQPELVPPALESPQTEPSADHPAVDDESVSDEAILTRDKLIQRLVTVVSERTGYPEEMLDLELDLEADLGIDSIKRVEILGSLQKDQLLPAGESSDQQMEELSRLKTLAAIADWIMDRVDGTSASTPTVATTRDAATEPVTLAGNDSGVVVDDDRPTPRLVLKSIELESAAPARLQIDGVVVLTDDGRGIARAIAEQLTQQGFAAVVLMAHVDERGDGDHMRIDMGDPAAISFAIDQIRRKHGPIAALLHLLPLGSAGSSESTDRWYPLLESELHSLFLLSQSVESDLREHNGQIIVTTQMGSSFGSAQNIPAEFLPIQGGVVGFVKALSRERPEIMCRAIDFDSQEDAEAIVRALMSELGMRDEVLEVGYSRGVRRTLTTEFASLDNRSDQSALDDKSVFFITGGARGITAQIAIEIAQQFQPTLVLVGRSSEPRAEDDDLAPLETPRQLKSALTQRLIDSGEKPTPAVVEQMYRRLMQDREMRANLAAMREAGATVLYESADVTDDNAIGRLIEQVYSRLGRIDVVIHGAGVTEDKFLADKTLDSFDRVVRPKVKGALTLIRSLNLETIKHFVFFSSVSARYGNRGQSDYAAANEVLNKLALWLNKRCPGRVVSINWGPWESEGGMVSAELAKRFESAGVHMISRPAGRRAFIEELRYGAKHEVEVVYGGPIRTEQQQTQEHRSSSAQALLSSGTNWIPTQDGYEVTRTLDTAQDLYLLDHQLDGKPVMPMAMVLELFAEVASQGWPAWSLSRVRELRVLKGITLDNGAGELVISANKCSEQGNELIVDLQVLLSGSKVTSYTAQAVLHRGGSRMQSAPILNITHKRPFQMSVDQAYQTWLFHGPLFAAIEEVVALGDNGIIGRLSPSSPQRCLAEAPSAGWIVDPVIVDGGLQLLILWARTHLDMTPLPSRLGCFHHIARHKGGDVVAEVYIRPESAGAAIHADLVFKTAGGDVFAWLEDMEVTCSKSLNRLSASPSSLSGRNL